jgi:pyrimidine operon attenuation protein/uracil phosphoribosyltransferase
MSKNIVTSLRWVVGSYNITFADIATFHDDFTCTNDDVTKSDDKMISNESTTKDDVIVDDVF